MEKIRAFIAIELTDGLKKELGNIESVLKAGNSAPVKWVDPESIHLTLKFLGDVEADRVEEIIQGIENACTGVPSFQLEIRGLGVFPNPVRTQVAWAGIAGDTDKLNRLQQNIESEMEKLGYDREERKFSPHLTLGRVRNHTTPDERKRFGSLVTTTSFESGLIKADSVNLMRSRLTKQGAIYSRLGSIILK